MQRRKDKEMTDKVKIITDKRNHREEGGEKYRRMGKHFSSPRIAPVP